MLYLGSMKSGILLAMLSGMFAIPNAIQAHTSGAAEVCFDAVVSARIVRQVPSVVPEPGEGDYIIMSWPYFIDLDVLRVLEGDAPIGRSTMLSVQHTYWRRGLGTRKWWLRRNKLGGFNILRNDDNQRFVRCDHGGPAAEPYVSPGEGRTLEDLIREGKERYGQRP